MEWLIGAGIVWLIVSFVVAGEFQSIANDKGYYGGRYFWYSFLFGIAGWAVVIALPDKKASGAMTAIAENLKRQAESNRTELNKKASFSYNGNEGKEGRKNVPAPEASNSMKDTKETSMPERFVIPMIGEKKDSEICPKCGEVQKAGRSRCWKCGISFYRIS